MVILILIVTILVETSVVFWSAQFLKRELRRHSGKAEERHAEQVRKVDALSSMLNDLLRDLYEIEARRKKATGELSKEIYARFDGCLSYGAETVKTLGGLWEVSERQTAALQTLLGRADASETVKRLEEMLKNAPDVLSLEDETRLSRSMEEGISNLLQYQVGKGREQS